MRRWAIIDRFIRLNNYTSVVELGVWKGATMTYVSRRNPEVHYYGIDLYAIQPHGACESYTAGENGEEWDHDMYYKSMLSFCEAHPHAHIIRDSTQAAADHFIDGSIDLVFVDADHSYEGVKGDINVWWPKIRSGGMMLGHDYNAERFPGVIQAVDERFDHVEKYDDTVWAVRKP